MTDQSSRSSDRLVGDPLSPITLATIIIVSIAALYVGAGILVPLVLAVLLAFALTPMVNRFRRWHFPHVVAVILSVLVATAVLAVISYVVATQLVALATELPNYQSTVAAKLKGLQQSHGGLNFLDRLSSAVGQLKAQIAPDAVPTLGAGSAGTPIPVTIANNPDNPFGLVQSVLGSVLAPLATAAIVVVFLVFLLLERADLRDRFLKLVSRGDLRTSTKVMDDAAARVGRYLLMQFTVNIVYGIILGGGLTLIGVPNGILWGLLATLFRYIPFVGTLILAIIPFTLAFAVDPGWSMLLASVALFVVLETVATNVVEPRLYGSSTGLSALAVLIAAMFWATLWGPIGLILATPLTVCLVVIGRYVPQLQFLETLLGSEPVLQPEQRMYQRLVAGNSEEAMDLADSITKTSDSSTFYEQVAIPALRLAELDLSIDPADVVQRRRLVESLEDVIEELEQEVEVGDEGAKIAVIGGRTELDGAAARILASVLRRNGTPARVLPPIAVRREALGQFETNGLTGVCLVYLGSRAASYARSVVRRLKREHPGLLVAVCILAESTSESTTSAVAGADSVAGSVVEMARLLRDWLSPTTASVEAEPSLDAPPMRTKLALANNPGVGEFLKKVAEAMNVAVAVANAASSDDAALATREETLRGEKLNGSTLLIDRVVATGKVLTIVDAVKDKEFAEEAFFLESGVRFFAGAPLREADDSIVGVLSIMDESPRQLTEEEERQLVSFAQDLMLLVDDIAQASNLGSPAG
jgi:predicted PurR-regulated permease PerM